MNRHILTIGLLLIGISVFSQKLEFDIKKNKLSDFLLIESKLGDERLENRSRHILQKGLAQPVEFRHPQKGLPDLVAYYFYYEKDSTLDNVLYEWDDNNFNNYAEIPRKSTDEIKNFIDKYEELYNQITKAYGRSENSSGNLNDTAKIETGDFAKHDTWNTIDSTRIELVEILSHKYEKRGAITTPRVYRIRLSISTLSKKENEKKLENPDEKKITELDLIFQSFLLNLKNKEFGQAKLNISSTIANSVTTEQLENLKRDFNLEDSLIVYFSGVQMDFNGSSYLMLQYKYKSDRKHPPGELIKVVFDDKNKILSVLPTKRN